MAYDEGLAERLRDVLVEESGITERKMFGGLAFLLHDNMCCGVNGEQLMLRIGADGEAAALAEPHARPMDFTGRPLAGFVYVGAEGFESDADLEAWVARAVAFARTLPAK
jgi:TfoX/Sxy family transcriptional regulator of competence genes